MDNNDRIDPELLEGTSLPKPEVEIIVSGEKIVKPGMKTYFVRLDDDGETVGETGNGKTVYGTVCTCDTVAVCTCVSVPSCSCLSVYSTSCSCNQVCTCVPVH